MLVAKDKVKNNVGEYLVYMYQIEDLIRACNFDKDKIESTLVKQYEADDTTRNEIRNWYYGLSDLMEEEQIQKNGHLSIIDNKVNEVNEFHQYLLVNTEHKDYQDAFIKTSAILEELKQKSKGNNNDIKLIIDTIYGYYLLKLKKQDISKGTQDSIAQFSQFLALLSKKFKAYEKGDIVIELD